MLQHFIACFGKQIHDFHQRLILIIIFQSQVIDTRDYLALLKIYFVFDEISNQKSYHEEPVFSLAFMLNHRPKRYTVDDFCHRIFGYAQILASDLAIVKFAENLQTVSHIKLFQHKIKILLSTITDQYVMKL